ncbi:MAG: DUF3168 domain-containing protein [Pseudomonadota bacterium]
MTMSLSAPLQLALYERLTTAPALASLQGRVYDDAPHRNRETSTDPYVTIGEESVRPWNTATDFGAIHDAVVSVHAPRRGFLDVKALAATIAEVIVTDPPAPERGRIVCHEFVAARTRREEQGALRRIDVTFRFVIEDAPAG